MPLLAAAALSLAGCGIQPTGVVDAGEPARGPIAATPRPSAGPSTRVYFVLDGELVATPYADVPPGDAELALKVLLGGPPAHERGLVTELPRGLTQLTLLRRGAGTVTVATDVDPRELSDLAAAQITCTFFSAVPEKSEIRLIGPAADRFLPPVLCPAPA
jgi:hypothetical protein